MIYFKATLFVVVLTFATTALADVAIPVNQASPSSSGETIKTEVPAQKLGLTLEAWGGPSYQDLAPTSAATSRGFSPHTLSALYGFHAVTYRLNDPSDPQSQAHPEGDHRTLWNKWGDVSYAFGTVNLAPGSGGSFVNQASAELEDSKLWPVSPNLKWVFRINQDTGNDGSFNTTGARQTVFSLQGGVAIKESKDGNIIGKVMVGPSGDIDGLDVANPIIQPGASARISEEAYFGPYVSAFLNLDGALYYYGETVGQVSAGVRVGSSRDAKTGPIFYVQPEAVFGSNYAKSTGQLNDVRGITLTLEGGMAFNAL